MRQVREANVVTVSPASRGGADAHAFMVTNATEALKWYHRAADQGDAAAMIALGDMYRDGRGSKPDNVEAMRLYGLAAAEPPSTSASNSTVALAEFSIGSMYQRGLGVPKDERQAGLWYCRSAKSTAKFEGSVHKPSGGVESAALVKLAATIPKVDDPICGRTQK